jgi:opacity protein-like surface antigen
MKFLGAALIFVLGGLCATWSAEKETFDVYAVTGYGIGMGGRDVGASTTTNNGELTSKQDNFLNLGAGLKLECGANIRLMPNLYAQGALCYGNGMWGINNVVENITIAGDDKITDQYVYSTFGIKALLKPTFQIFDLFTAYTGFGMGLYFAGLTIHHSEVGPGVNLSARADDGQWPAFAFEGSLGLDYPITQSVIIFGELQCEVMNFMTSQRTITNSNYPDGTDWNNQIINYQTNATDRKTPYSTPGTNVGIRVGVKFPLM